MPNQQLNNQTPTDIRTLWGVNGETLDYAERAYRQWQKGAEEMQTHAFDYFNNGMTRALEAMREMAKCESAADAIGVQSRYANEAMQGFIDEGKRVIDQLKMFTQSPWAVVPTAAVEAAAQMAENAADENGSRKRS